MNCKHDWTGDDDCQYCRVDELTEQVAKLDADAAAEKAEAASWKAVAHDHSERLERMAQTIAELREVDGETAYVSWPPRPRSSVKTSDQPSEGTK